METNLADTPHIGHQRLDSAPFVKYVLPTVVLQPFLAEAGLTVDDLLYKNRPKLAAAKCQRLTDLLWPSFVASIREGNEVDADEAKTHLAARDQSHVRAQYRHAVFKHADNLFVAEFEMNGTGAEVLRCWKAPSADVHPATVFVTFGEVAEKEAFDKLAAKLGYKSDELILRLARDFARTVRRDGVKIMP